MKKLLFFGVIFLLGATLSAQEPLKDIKKAARQLATYNLNPEDAGKLTEAVALAEASIGDPAVQADPASWQIYGEVYLTAMNVDVQEIVLNSGAPIKHPSAAAKSFEGFRRAAEGAVKSYQVKDAMKALAGGLQNMYYMGSALYQANDFKNAFGAFKATYEGFALTQKNNEESDFDPKEHSKTLYYAALCAQQAGMKDEAKSALQQLVASGTAEPDVYEALIAISAENEAEVEKLLAEARAKYPNDLALLYSEINHYLAKGELTSLIAKLEQAIAIEPNNVSVYVTLGQVYDKLYQDQMPTDPAVAEENFTKALEYYQQGLEKDARNFDAVYSIGALWYNKAAAYSTQLNAFSDDYSAEGTRKFEAKKKEMDDAFANAQPYFLRAEEINPEDLNTLIALREIYARQDNFTKVEEYKAKIEANAGKQ